MDKIEKIDGIRKSEFSKISEYIDGKKIKSAEKLNDRFQQKQDTHSQKKEKKSIELDLQELLIALEKTLQDYNAILDKRKKDLYIFYEIVDNVNILINVANTQTGEYIFKHKICLECIKTDKDFFRIIDDLIRERGILIDYNA
ncbi:MAG TPA: hypothetical protein PLM75_06170 [bacterium]|nr:hypothetical protein [bacterium]HPP87428.1 hypothetical protein [bacterium]